MSTESDTPRVNDYIGIGNEDHMTEGEIAVCDFARQLERELNEVTKQRDDLKKAMQIIASDGEGQFYWSSTKAIALAQKTLEKLTNETK